ncbi:hypothetical protein BOTBODRAFT_49837 [Botryobasidium botryosum FD-172 SS1]|uniref:HAT C-terminal dimerisation domain-containing protein n=1 Tax=Botryobasidium botryosum (strain FD-172 SS1) TaxID=930990 RepID=A0A067N2E6_BOTB1|nr:hypothetical protein BOTBODRAFT_49837 [Botryobasidium botryosum FD-172 SS1]
MEIGLANNNVRCFPHVINIAVTAGIESLTVTTPEFSAKYPRYAKILEENIIAKARAVVTACRTSGQRRADFRATIEDGNKHGTFKDTLRLLQLLRDVNTRWSSLYLMIERLLYLYPAVGCFLDQSKQRSIAGIALDSDQLRVLRDIQTFLQVLHTVQELLSAQNTPTLAFVMPLYESLIDMLKALRAKLPGLAPAIMATVSKLEEYVLNSRKSRIYALATSECHKSSVTVICHAYKTFSLAPCIKAAMDLRALDT